MYMKPERLPLDSIKMEGALSIEKEIRLVAIKWVIKKGIHDDIKAIPVIASKNDEYHIFTLLWVGPTNEKPPGRMIYLSIFYLLKNASIEEFKILHEQMGRALALRPLFAEDFTILSTDNIF